MILFMKAPRFLYLAMSYAKAFTLNKAHNERISYMGYYNTGAWRVYKSLKA